MSGQYFQHNMQRTGYHNSQTYSQPLKIEELIDFITQHYPKNMSTVSDVSLHSEQHNILMEQETPINKRFNELFGEYSSHIECIETIETVNDTFENISLCSAFLSCVLDNFDSLEKNDKSICVTKFFAKILSEVKKRDGLNKYITPTFVWDKKELVNALTNYKMIPNVFAYVITYMNINAFIISDESILLYCMSKLFNTFKQTIMIFYDGKNYKPLSYNGNKIWKFANDEPLKYLVEKFHDSITVYQQNKSDIPIEFKVGYDKDVEFVWTNNTTTTTQQVQTEENKINGEDVSKEDKEDKEDNGGNDVVILPTVKQEEIPDVSEKEESSDSDNDHEDNHDNKKESKIAEETKVIVKLPKKQSRPETTEQVLDAVFYKNPHSSHHDETEMDNKQSETKMGKSTKISIVKEDLKASSSHNKKKQEKSDDESDDETDNDSSSENDSDSENDKLTEKELNKLKCSELHTVAKNHGIKLTIKHDGKMKPKTKKELITELLKL